MLASPQSVTSIAMPTSETPQAVLAVARPVSQSLDGSMGAVGVAAVVRDLSGVSQYWLAGYAKSDDMARAAMVQHLLALHSEDAPQLVVWSNGMDALKHVPAARLNSGMRSGKNKRTPFGAYALFEPLEAALRRGEWHLQTYGGGEEPVDYYTAQRLAQRGLWVARERAVEFPSHRKDHPDWWMLEAGSTENPLAERRE